MTRRRANPFAIGAFVVGALAIMVAALIVLPGRHWFDRPQRVVMFFSGSVFGLQQCAPVVFRGVRVGSVTEARVQPDTFLASLTLRIDGTFRLPRDSSAEITSEGLLGGRFVALVPGGADQVLQNGALIANTQSAVSLESLLGRFLFSPGGGTSQDQAPAPQGAPPQGSQPQGSPR